VVFASGATGDFGAFTGSFGYDTDVDAYSNMNIFSTGWADVNDVNCFEQRFF
jgi:hypothetical protein